MSTEPDQPAFSVIVPLEFHRGTADDCVRAWTRQTDFPRSDYEIILAAPTGFAEADLRALQELLGAGDRVLRLPHRHDIPLCAEAARQARGATFFFTESHAVPEPNVLAICARAMTVHPEWSGFSVASQRSVHNPLSIIEADMYEADIAEGMAPGHWRKILDQCFVVKREAYFAAGGFDPTLGHFAEWMLAARCYRMGLAIGYVPDGRIRHVYPGDLDEWREFTRDFVEGEITALARGDSDGLADLFGFVPEWAARETWNQVTARQMVVLCLLDTSSVADTVATLVRWLPAAWGGNRLRLVRGRMKARVSWWRAQRQIGNDARNPAALEALRTVVLASMGALVHAERLRVIARWMDRRPTPPTARADGAWEPGRDVSIGSAGFHAPERRGDQAFAWSEPMAMVHLPLGPGRYEIVVEWLVDTAHNQIGAPRLPRLPRFYCNERALPAAEVLPREGRARMTITVVDAQPARLAWVCRGHAAPSGIRRRRGLPLRRVSWRSVGVQEAPQEGVQKNLQEP